MKTKQEIQEIRQDIDAALLDIAKKHGVEKFKLGSIRYDADGFRTTIEAQYQGAETSDMKTLKVNAPFMGFKKEIAGANIKYIDKAYKVVGMKRTNLLLESGGKVYVANIERVKSYLQKHNSPYLVEESVVG